MPSNRVKRLLRKIESLRGRKKQKISGSDDEGDKGPSSVWTPKSLGDYPTTNIYNSSSRSPPAELFRKDLISAMKLPDNEFLASDEYWFISDHWKQEWERGVQVPVNPESLPESAVRILRKKDRSANFKLPKKLVRLTRDEFFSDEIHKVSNCATLADKMCRYDLDNLDLHWLESVNDQRKQMDLPPIEENAMEKIVEELEIQCGGRMQEAINSEAVLGIEYDEDVICDVCRSPDSEEGNEMVFCDSCDICVHQACYGITSIPEGSWLCRTCSMSIKRPSCVLCPNKGGAMKCTRTGQWAHVSCALWIPEVSIGCVEKMEPITKIGLIPSSRWSLVCCVCRDRSGACIQCTVKSCKTAYHVTCGFKSGLEMQAIFEDDSDDEGVKLKSYCPKHSKDKESSVSSESEDEEEKLVSSNSTKSKISSEEKANARAKRLRQIESSFFNYVKVEEVAKAVHSALEIVQSIYHYWKLKRRAAFNAALLPPNINENDLLSQGQEDDLYARTKMFVHLRQDLERVRNLCYMVSRREKLSRSWTRMREQIFNKQVSVIVDSSLNLNDDEKRNIVHACHGGNLYDRMYSSDPNCCASSPFSSLLATTAANDSEMMTVDTNGTRSKRNSGGERLPNPYAKLYNGLNGVSSRARPRSDGTVDNNDREYGVKNVETLEEAELAVEKLDKLNEHLNCNREDIHEISRQSPQHFTRSASHKIGSKDSLLNNCSEQSRDFRNNSAATSRSSRFIDCDQATTTSCDESAKVDLKYASAKENMERLVLDVSDSNNVDWKKEEDCVNDEANRRHHRHKKSKQRFRNLRSPSERNTPREKDSSSASNFVTATVIASNKGGTQSPTSDTQTSPFKDKLRQETAKIHESLFSSSSLKGSLAGYRIPKKTRSESESDVKANDADVTVANVNQICESEQQQQQLQQPQSSPTSPDVKSEQPHYPSQPYRPNHWREVNNSKNNYSDNPLQIQTQRWNCTTRPLAVPLLPSPPHPMMMMMPVPQYDDRRVTRRDRASTIYQSTSSSDIDQPSPHSSLNGERDECSAGRLIIKLRKDRDAWRRDGDIVSNNNNPYEYECEANDELSPPSRHSRLKMSATRYDGHHVNVDPRLRGPVSPSISNNRRQDPRTFIKSRGVGVGREYGGRNTYSMRSRTSLGEHNNFS